MDIGLMGIGGTTPDGLEEKFRVKTRKLCVVTVCVILLLFESALAETLFLDDFEGNAEFKWPDMPTIKIGEDPGNPDNSVLVFDTENDQNNVDALFLEGFEDLMDYTMQAKFNIVGETSEACAYMFGSSLYMDGGNRRATP